MDYSSYKRLKQNQKGVKIMNESIETVLNSFLMEMYKWEDNANKHITRKSLKYKKKVAL